MTPQRASLSLDGTLSSIIAFQLNRAQGEPCYKYKPSDQVLKRSKEVTWEYNKEHSKNINITLCLFLQKINSILKICYELVQICFVVVLILDEDLSFT